MYCCWYRSALFMIRSRSDAKDLDKNLILSYKIQYFENIRNDLLTYLALSVFLLLIGLPYRFRVLLQDFFLFTW